MKKYLRFLLIIPSLFIVVTACGKKEVIKPSEESVKAQRALAVFSQMEEAYKKRDLQGTLKDVSRDLKKSYAEFASAMRKDMDLYPKVDMDVDLDRVEEEDNFIRVVYHWSGTWTDKEGGTHNARGSGAYVYQDTGSSIILTDFIGDSPFGVAR